MKTSNICVIPARMGSSRFPNKPLKNILGFPMLGHVIERCRLERVFDDVVVAACDAEVVQFCEALDVKCIMTSDTHERASDRVQEAVQTYEKELGYKIETVTLVQGDEPMVTPSMLKLALSTLENNSANVVNLRSKILDKEEYQSINCVKVVVDLKDRALYFSRAPIPTPVKKQTNIPLAYKQVCIIPFARDFLDEYSRLKPTPLEIVESVDMNRVIEHGYEVLCVETNEQSFPVDVPEDLVRVERYISSCPLTAKYLKDRSK